MSFIESVLNAYIRSPFSNRPLQGVRGVLERFEETMEHPPAPAVLELPLAERIRQAHAQQGGVWDPEFNLIGVRWYDNQEDAWNDLIGAVYLIPGYSLTNDQDRPQWTVELFEGTTDPSRHFTVHPLSPDGAAHLTLGFPKNIWVVGTHRGYKAFAQWGAQVTCWRDKNRNRLEDDNLVTRGWYGINGHHGNDSSAPTIGYQSAGCQVVRRKRDLARLLKLAEHTGRYLRSRKKESVRFSYMLFDHRMVPFIRHGDFVR